MVILANLQIRDLSSILARPLVDSYKLVLQALVGLHLNDIAVVKGLCST
jgi:hypothetical protein